MSSSSPGRYHYYQADQCSDQVSEDSDSIEDSSDEQSTSEDEFDAFAHYKGTGKVKKAHYSQEQYLMCLHYFSDALGLQFGNTNEEVYKLDQIKEWAPPESKWLEQPPDLLGTQWIFSTIFFSLQNIKSKNGQW